MEHIWTPGAIWTPGITRKCPSQPETSQGHCIWQPYPRRLTTWHGFSEPLFAQPGELSSVNMISLMNLQSPGFRMSVRNWTWPPFWFWTQWPRTWKVASQSGLREDVGTGIQVPASLSVSSVVLVSMQAPWKTKVRKTSEECHRDWRLSPTEASFSFEWCHQWD